MAFSVVQASTGPGAATGRAMSRKALSAAASMQTLDIGKSDSSYHINAPLAP
jgi:hypothetical protein